MTGPEHYSAGEERMRVSYYKRVEAGDGGDLTPAMHEAAMAQAHFLAALVAVHAEEKFTDRVAWQKAVGW